MSSAKMITMLGESCAVEGKKLIAVVSRGSKTEKQTAFIF
jgi:hypothetical protein